MRSCLGFAVNRATGEAAIDFEQLQRAVSVADPSAVLVSPRILRRVIKRDLRNVFLSSVPSRQTCYVISGAALSEIVDGPEVGRPAGGQWPETVLLIARPDLDELADSPPGAILTIVWRRLFRARAQAEVQRRLDSGSIDQAGLSARIDAIGRTEFAEARTVLRQDGLLLPPPTDAAAYRTFAGTFLELISFAPALRAHTFPAIEDADAVERVLAADVSATAVLAKTRPAGAPAVTALIGATAEADAAARSDTGAESIDGDRESVEPPDSRRRDAHVRRLVRRAENASKQGNDVREAILRAAAAAMAGARKADPLRASARAALKQLARRLQKALFVRKGESELWAGALTPLLRNAARGFWTPEARLLYDLQKVCIDYEREVFRLHPIDWAVSLGSRPLKRPLPHLREVTMSSHLRSAEHRLPKVRLSREERGRLEALLRPAVHRAEDALRARFRPVIDATLKANWVGPKNPPERVAYLKLIEELLDQIVSRGFLTLGDLRDAASRSNLKLPDLSGPAELASGDRLLRSDRALAEVLDGVHRRGEVYLRALQRFSALAFGNPVGRFLTLYGALPFGGTFLALEGLQHLLDLAVKPLTGKELHLAHLWTILPIGMLVLGLINSGWIRRQFVEAVRVVGRLLRFVFVDLPAWILSNPLLHRVLTNRVVVAGWRYVLKPVLFAAPVWAYARLVGMGTSRATIGAATAFLGSSVIFNTRLGRALEEVVIDRLNRAWRALIFDIAPGLFRWLVWAFESLLEWIERLIYAVDEWLRFRSGQSGLVLVVKVVLGMMWAVVAYVVRIYVNLLIEPQINPIKHFPVVTVSHKLILPLLFRLTRILATVLVPVMGKWAGNAFAGANVLLLPGVFGFLVWELKANWRLYEANRPEVLGPVVVGSHGETVVRLLRPGFHSGTLPKLFAKLRKAERPTGRGGREMIALKRRESLHHVEEAIRKFVERDFVAMLHESRALGTSGIRTGAIRLATNRIRIELFRERTDRANVWIDLEEQASALSGRISRSGWLDTLDPVEHQTLEDAMIGLFKMSGVAIVPGEDGQWADFAEQRVSWGAWVAAWDAEHAGAEPVLGPGCSDGLFDGVTRRRNAPRPVAVPARLGGTDQRA
jgi:hypothetical protein